MNLQEAKALALKQAQERGIATDVWLDMNTEQYETTLTIDSTRLRGRNTRVRHIGIAWPEQRPVFHKWDATQQRFLDEGTPWSEVVIPAEFTLDED